MFTARLNSDLILFWNFFIACTKRCCSGALAFNRQISRLYRREIFLGKGIISPALTKSKYSPIKKYPHLPSSSQSFMIPTSEHHASISEVIAVYCVVQNSPVEPKRPRRISPTPILSPSTVKYFWKRPCAILMPRLISNSPHRLTTGKMMCPR